jgi:hypothetical protein
LDISVVSNIRVIAVMYVTLTKGPIELNNALGDGDRAEAEAIFADYLLEGL